MAETPQTPDHDESNDGVIGGGGGLREVKTGVWPRGFAIVFQS